MRIKDVKCHLPWTCTIIDQDGAVALCCYTADTSVGDLKDTPFEQIWNGATMRDARRSFLNGEFPPICLKMADRCPFQSKH